MRLPSPHQSEEAVSLGESVFSCTGAAVLHLSSPTAVIVRRSTSSAVSVIHTPAMAIDQVTRRIARNAISTRIDGLHCQDVDALGRASGIPSPVRQGTWLQRRRNVPPGTWRHVHAKVAKRYRNTSACCCSTSRRPTGVASTPTFPSTNADGKTPNATSLWYARYLRRVLTLRRFCRTSPSKLSAMPLGIICLPTGAPPAFSSFWWISPSFCLSS